VAVMWHDHRQVGSDEWRRTGSARIAAAASEIPNRISHAFRLDGPSLAIDASCSSSLAALHLAVESLRRGECGAAVVGAVNLVVHPYHVELLSGLDLLAAGGSAGAFDAEAPGWSPGEGAGALLLRPAAAAARDRDVVHGVVEATGVGYAGNGGRFGAPDAGALAGSIARTLAEASLTPAQIDYVECAAAGASVADAAEIEALGRVLGAARPGAALPVGTLKPNIGHLEAASGLSQLTKALLQGEHGELAPTIASERPNPLVPWDGLRLVDRLEAWRPSPPGSALRTLVNAVGATGTFGHAVVRSGSAAAGGR